MYEKRFGFNGRPFAAAPCVERYFPAHGIEHARTTIARAIQRSQGPALLIGPSGTGKTLVCQLLREQFRSQFRVALLANAHLATQKALLQSILFELALPYRDMDEGELRLGLIDHLLDPDTCPNGLLLLVDEACALPVKLLEEIRMITNLVCDGESRVRVALAGGDRLEEKFVSPRLDSFNQRIAARCYLGSLSRDETMGYVRAQIAHVGGDPPQVISEDALAAVYQSTDGIPRLINQLCDHALIRAAVAGSSQLDADMVKFAWADLQQLPTQGSGAGRLSSREGLSEAADVVEFGELDHDEPPVTLQVNPDQATIEVAGQVEPEDRVDQLSCDIVEAAGAAGPDIPAELHGHSDAGLDSESKRAMPAGPASAGEATPPMPLPASDDSPIEDHIVSLHQDYQQEEVVLDRYATLDAAFFQQRHQVFSDESGEIATALSALWAVKVQVGTPTDSAHVRGTSTGQDAETDAHLSAMVKPLDRRDPRELAAELQEGKITKTTSSASDAISEQIDQMQEMVTHTVQWQTIEPLELAGKHGAELPEDDRDLILVEDAGGEVPARKTIRASRQPKRGQYRQLFARLRRG